MSKNIKLYLLVTFLFAFTDLAEGRIRMRKVKDAPRTCAMMKEDSLLGRDDKPIYSTERHSLVVSDTISLVNDLGVKVCSWQREQLSAFGDLNQFRFYIDEYKEYLYPHIKTADGGYLLLKVPMKDCSLDERVSVASLDFPKCEKPAKKKKSKKRKKKK